MLIVCSTIKQCIKTNILKPLGPVTISSKPSYQRRGDNGEPREEVNVQDVAETGCAVLGLYFSWVPEDDRGSSARSVGFLQRANTMIRYLDESALLCHISIINFQHENDLFFLTNRKSRFHFITQI